MRFPPQVKKYMCLRVAGMLGYRVYHKDKGRPFGRPFVTGICPYRQHARFSVITEVRTTYLRNVARNELRMALVVQRLFNPLP